MSDALVQSATIQLKAQAGGGFGSVPSAPLPVSLTLTGAGFEAIANPKPTAFDTFNDYSGLVDGDEIPRNTLNPYWNPTINTTYLDNNQYVLDGTIKSPDDNFSARGGPSGGNPINPSVDNQYYRTVVQFPKKRPEGPPRSNTEFFVTFEIRFNEKLAKIADGGDQPLDGSNKILRVWDDAGESGDGFRISWKDVSGLQINGIYYYPDSTKFAQHPNEFHKCDLYFNDTTKNLKVWIGGKKVLDETNAAFGHIPGFTSPTDTFQVRGLGHDISEGNRVNQTLKHWLRGFYEHPTIARVELSNDPVFDDTNYQIRVHQHVESRTDGNIYIPKARYGDLNRDATIYAFITKTDGTVVNYGSVS